MTIGILDDHELLAELLKDNLSRKLTHSKIHIFTTTTALFTFLENDKLDFLFLDFYINQENGLTVLKTCRKDYSNEDLKIIMLSSCIEPKIIADTFKAGANGYACKNDAVDEIIDLFNEVNQSPNKTKVSPRISDVLLEHTLSGSAISLSPREDELLQLICKAKTAKEIAYELNLSLNTIHYYTKRLMNKMGVNRTPDLILKAIEKGYYNIH
jgi:DNA-binding NarL/FixJ family response regulator